MRNSSSENFLLFFSCFYMFLLSYVNGGFSLENESVAPFSWGKADLGLKSKDHESIVILISKVRAFISWFHLWHVWYVYGPILQHPWCRYPLDETLVGISRSRPLNLPWHLIILVGMPSSCWLYPSLASTKIYLFLRIQKNHHNIRVKWLWYLIIP